MRRMPSRRACSRKSGVVSMSTVRPPYSTSTEGRVRWSRGSGELHTAQVHPIVGTPMDVPLPSTVSVAFIAWSSSLGGGLRRLRPTADGVGHFHVGHAQLVQAVLDEMLFRGGQIALGLLREQFDGVNGLARANDVHLSAPAFFAQQTELHER